LERDYKFSSKQMETLVKNYNNQGVALSNRSHENHWLKEENKRLREALEEIAEDTGTPYSDVARRALEGSE